MPPYEVSGRHRDPRLAPGYTQQPRRPGPSAPTPSRLRQALLAALVVTLVIDITLFVLHEMQARANERDAFLPLPPAVSFPAPATTTPKPSRSPARAKPRATTAPPRTVATSLIRVRRSPSRTTTTPAPTTTAPQSPRSTPTSRSQLLGPNNLGQALAGYCESSGGRGTGVGLARDGWYCVQWPDRAWRIDMDAACRQLYGSPVRARLLDSTDQRSWRCYRDTP
ncbi:hypothetical protein KRMM14A1259_66730 [Krasilnikovia sp. MM14-A1259]